MNKALKKRGTPQVGRLYRRIGERLAELGKKEQAASIAAGLGASFIRDIGRKGSMPSAANLDKIARALETTPDWLLGREAPTPQRQPRGERAGLRYIGEVAAGQWLETPPFELDADVTIPVMDVRYPTEVQYTLGVRGTSINRTARPGALLICVDIARAGIEVANGDLVVVQRRRAQGGLTEVTAKIFRRKSSTVVELLPDSDDPRWQEPIVLDDAKSTGDEDVSVIALVTGVYRPVRGGTLEV